MLTIKLVSDINKLFVYFGSHKKGKFRIYTAVQQRDNDGGGALVYTCLNKKMCENGSFFFTV